LTDQQRWPWLEAVANAASSEFSRNDAPVFVACSALKRGYRDFLRQTLGSLSIVYLTGEVDLIRRRLEDRRSHFMPPRLLDSQLSELEEPGSDEGGIPVNIDCDPEDLTRAICEKLGLGGSQAR
jgi:gluconokinase